MKKEKEDWIFKCFGCGFNFRSLTNATNVKFLPEKCNKCASRIIEADYSKDLTPFPEKLTKYTGCLVCDPVLRSLISPPKKKGEEEGKTKT